MNRSTRWLGLFLCLAIVLGVLTVSAQIRQDPRVPPRLSGAGRGTDDLRLPPAPARMAETRSALQGQHGGVRVAALSWREVREWDNRAIRMERDGELRLRRVQEDTVLRDRQHERYDQLYKGVPVFGGDVVRQTDGTAALSILGTVYEGIDLGVEPVLTPEDAVVVFERRVRTPASPALRPELMILPKDDGSYALVYRISQFTGNALPVLFVNATTGLVEREYDNLQTQQPAIGIGTGVLGDQKKFSGALFAGTYLASDQMRPPVLMTYDLKGNLLRTKYILNGWLPVLTSDIASDADNSWTDAATVDAHCHVGWTYDFLYKRFGRRGLDGNNTPLRAIVHPVDALSASAPDFDTYVIGAFWVPGSGTDGKGYMVFGDGLPSSYYATASGQHVAALAGAIDIVAHELTHGLTEFTSDLIYEYESGALNEAFSDIIGTSAEFFFQTPGNGSQKADYLIGEDVFTPHLAGTKVGSRSLADPMSYGDPDHYSRRFLGSADYGYVHSNSQIAAHTFYLAIEGGTNRTSGLSVQGVGASNREQIEKVFYRAFVYYLTSNATFSAARAATIWSAQELYGTGSAAHRAVTQAWDAVGVY